MHLAEIPITDELRELSARLRESAGRRLTKEEIFEQEVSFVYGNMPSKSTITKEQVREYLLEQRGGL